MAKGRTEQPSDGGFVVENDDGNAPVGDNRSDSTLDGIAIVEPASLGSGGGNDNDNGAVTGKRKRGRPAGSGNTRKPTQKEVRTAVSGIEPLLLSLHKGVAGLLKSPEFELDAEEAKMLAENMTNVASQYSVEVNPKYMAWIGLVGCLIAVYGPRVGAMAVRKAVKKSPAPQAEPPAPSPLRAVEVQPFMPPQSFTG